MQDEKIRFTRLPVRHSRTKPTEAVRPVRRIRRFECRRDRDLRGRAVTKPFVNVGSPRDLRPSRGSLIVDPVGPKTILQIGAPMRVVIEETKLDLLFFDRPIRR